MKKLVLAMVAFVAVATTSFAQYFTPYKPSPSVIYNVPSVTYTVPKVTYYNSNGYKTYVPKRNLW